MVNSSLYLLGAFFILYETLYLQPMKFITFIVAVCMLTFSVMPCYDTHDDCSTESLALVEHADNHTKDSEDFCSPFCVCFCCRNLVLQQDEIKDLEVQPTIFYLASQSIYSTATIPTAFLNNIWQPPKV